MSQNTSRTAGTRLRWALTGAVLLVMVGAGVVVGVLARQNLSRLELVDGRLRETGRFAGARARLQRRALELLPSTVPGSAPMVGDVLLQLRQARRLDDRLPERVGDALEGLDQALERPVVRREDLVEAASLLEAIANAESMVQEQIFSDARADIRTERNTTLLGLLALTVLALLGVWAVPRAAPFRALVRFWLRGILARRKMLVRTERLALAGEAAASLAHELRNPLAGVTLGLQNLERERDDLSPRIRPLVSELERVTRTLNDHLQALRTPVEEPTEVDVARLLSDLADLLRYEAESGVELAVTAPTGLRCRTQADRLRQVLLNLGLNALQALEGREGTVRFRAEASGGSLSLTVEDDGPGFPEAVLGGTLPPLSSSKPGGTGLGLRLARRMAGELGGVLELANRPEGGASAVVRIPCGEEGS